MDWKSLEGLLTREFHPSLFLEHAQQWVKHPIANIARADPLISLIWIVLAVCIAVYILNLVSGDYSWTDRVWSLCPIFYAWFFALSVPAPHNIQGNPIAKIKYLATNHPRVLLMAVLVTLWGIRLTFNFARKGGYGLGGEDYRWKHVHGFKAFNIPVLGPFLWQLFSLGFIAIYQHILIFMFTCPLYVAYRDAAANVKTVQSLTIYDYLLGAAFLVFLAIETIADEQQWRYYIRRDKYRALPKAEQNSAKWVDSDEARGFNTSGLFAYSRHPNFFGEQSIWVTFYLFAVVVTGNPLHWTGLGVLQLMVCIFLGSTDLTEKLSVAKYPAYRIYQKYVSRTIPMPFKRKIIWDDIKKKQ